jgi:hypothetical protein
MNIIEAAYYKATEAYLCLEGIAIPSSIRKVMCAQCPTKPEYMFGLCYSCYREKGDYISRDTGGGEDEIHD